MSVFGLYSRYYDLLYSSKDYRAEALHVLASLDQFSPGTKRILDLGCGTGMHATALAAAGHIVCGVDFSAEMLAEARSRHLALAADMREKLSFEHGDVRKFRNSQRYDAVISLFHVVSYQTGNLDLHQAFDTAAAHLSAGGVLAFDFWYGPAVLTQKPETRVRRMEDEHTRVLRIAESTVVSAQNRVDVKFTVFVEDKLTGEREELIESHPMRYLFLPEIDLFLEASGMQRVCASEWLTGSELTTNSWSAFVIARKR